MTMLNILGITRFVQLGPWALAVGVLPYPLTFLCTDLISELYGKKRANYLVTVGLGLNFFILGFIWLGQAMPVATSPAPWQFLSLAEPVPLPNGDEAMGQIELFSLLYATTSGAVFASMMATLPHNTVTSPYFTSGNDSQKANISGFAITPAQLSVRASIRSWSWLSHLARNS